jgi:hypothetical protein
MKPGSRFVKNKQPVLYGRFSGQEIGQLHTLALPSAQTAAVLTQFDIGKTYLSQRFQPPAIRRAVDSFERQKKEMASSTVISTVRNVFILITDFQYIRFKTPAATRLAG